MLKPAALAQDGAYGFRVRERTSAMSDGARSRGTRLIPPAWQARLRSGVRARVIVSLEGDHTEMPLDLVARIELQDPDLLSIHLALPEPAEPAGGVSHGVPALTPRERAVIEVVAMGKASEEIASMLSISPATVRTHVRNAMAKVGAHTRAQLIAIVLGNAGTSTHRDEEYGA